MKFDKEQYIVRELTLENETISYRAFLNLPYVERPVNAEYQQMNIFAPEVYYAGGSINGYDLNTAPVFMPNTVGGYMPGMLDEPGYTRFGPKKPNSIFRALQHGYVVAVPAIRGRTQKDAGGRATGKAPACVVDYKAAVRFLHYYSGELPGDEEKIITNGTSAGGALSSLVGATGNHPDYAPYLEEIGAPDARDDIFAASCYCPITDLDHADMAYEWEFRGVYDYHGVNMKTDESGRMEFTPAEDVMSDLQIRASEEEAKQFPAYVNSLGLTDESSNPLKLDEEGNGTFKTYVEQVVLASAQAAIERGTDVAGKPWLTVENGTAVGIDFAEYVKEITRMKTAPAFDDLTMCSPENSLFGTSEADCCHFTKYSVEHSLAPHPVLADETSVKVMNPMNYIEDEKAVKAPYWRIRHGERDRDTSLAVSAILTIKLRNAGLDVDYHSPWDVPHAGDYDLEELFAWIDGICK